MYYMEAPYHVYITFISNMTLYNEYAAEVDALLAPCMNHMHSPMTHQPPRTTRTTHHTLACSSATSCNNIVPFWDNVVGAEADYALGYSAERRAAWRMPMAHMFQVSAVLCHSEAGSHMQIAGGCLWGDSSIDPSGTGSDTQLSNRCVDVVRPLAQPRRRAMSWCVCRLLRTLLRPAATGASPATRWRLWGVPRR